MQTKTFSNRLRHINPAIIGYLKVAKEIDSNIIESLDNVRANLEGKLDIEFKDPEPFKKQVVEVWEIAQSKQKFKNGELLYNVAKNLYDVSNKLKTRQTPISTLTAEQMEKIKAEVLKEVLGAVRKKREKVA